MHLSLCTPMHLPCAPKTAVYVPVCEQRAVAGAVVLKKVLRMVQRSCRSSADCLHARLRCMTTAPNDGAC